ncbi:hypothetical protein [Embleya sp. NBC_00896]|uniref:hypothetical protein n=1 Tax=Embleya sp. NBC_00896 TaxID=2975961 RepID=UPI002F908718|nr:hypothetical protein OG928_39820 [Embleya sp. NBC_00896]
MAAVAACFGLKRRPGWIDPTFGEAAAGTTEPRAVLAETLAVGEYMHAVRALHFDAFAPPET